MAEQQKQKVSLAESHPELAKEWHPTKNGDLRPEDVTAGSGKRIWWRLSYDDPNTGKHFDFEWEALVKDRANGRGCPYLSTPTKAIWKGFNDLTTTNPELVTQWHPTKNGKLTPEDVTAGSNQKVWWLLPYDDPNTGKHFDFEWESTVADRSKGNDCPYLSGSLVWPGFNDLATVNPELASQWHPIKNGNLKPKDVTAGSNQKVWWHLPYDDPNTGKHFDFEWETIVASRVNGIGCPYLSGRYTWPGFNDLKTVNPELAKEWHPTKNGDLKPEDVTAGSGQKVWWVLPYDDPNTGKHFDFEWEATVADRSQGCKCPYLSGRAIWEGFNDLATTHPELAAEWHPTKNGKLKPEDVTAGSRQKIWWYLPYDDPNTGKHFDFEWETTIANRLNGRGCPYLSTPAAAIWRGFNDLTTTHPEIAAEWHPWRNGDLRPEDVTAGSNQKIWWSLPYDDPNTGKHFDFEWEATVAHRLKGNGCPYLSGRAIWEGFNDLATTHPELATEWHPTKNSDLKPEDVTAGSHQKIWWHLPYDDPNTGEHSNLEWEATIASRVNGSGCPYLTVWKTEKLIRSILVDLGVNFEEQKRFKETGRCAFDFHLPELNIIIEPDGEQHFTGWYTDKDKSLERYLKNDTMKNNFCLNNDISILRIPYIFDPVKQEDEIRSMILQFIQDRQVPDVILDFYAEQEGHNYYEVATKLNEINLEYLDYLADAQMSMEQEYDGYDEYDGHDGYDEDWGE